MNFKNFDNKYLPPDYVDSAFKYFQSLKVLEFQTFEIGKSVNNLPIKAYQVGDGKIKVLIFSQIHGDEPTATRGLLIFLNKALKNLKYFQDYTFFIIPQLNIDGALAHSRYNINWIDLNCDALLQSQPETQSLVKIIDSFKPQYCFSLHDQRNFYVAGEGGEPSTLAFLQMLNKPQKLNYLKSAQIIADIFNQFKKQPQYHLSVFVSENADQSFGTYCLSKGMNYLLFEAGFIPDNYLRSEVAEVIAQALELALDSIKSESYLAKTWEDYLVIPKNKPEYVDLVIRNLDFSNNKDLASTKIMTLIFKEELINGQIEFFPNVIKRQHYPNIKGYREINL